MLEGELSDPRIAPSYVTDVVLAPEASQPAFMLQSTGAKRKSSQPSSGL
jgi:ribosome-binding factor A